ncbi:MAG: T9SS type A sorting domain-containing protein [Bacteroidota bacterium]
MRRVALALLALATALPASGQDAVPDTTNPARYYPLGIGDEWRYMRWANVGDWGADEVYERRRAVDDVSVDGVLYTVVLRESASFSVPSWYEVARDTLRYDSTRALIIQRVDGRDTDASCPLGADYGSQVECLIDGVLYTTTVLGGEGIKRFAPSEVAVPHPVYVSGVGFVGFDNEPSDRHTDFPDLFYAQIDSDEVEYDYEAHPSGYVPDMREDSSPPWLYFPLHDGFVRESYHAQGGFGATRTRTEVLGDSLSEGQMYKVIWSATVPTEFAFTPTERPDSLEWGEGEVTLARYDTTSTQVMRKTESGEAPLTPPLGASIGSLANLGESPRSLPDGRTGDFAVFGATSQSLTISSDEVIVDAVKSFAPVPQSLIYDGPDQNWTYGLRIGRLPIAHYFTCGPPLCVQRITYVRTLDAQGQVVEYGATVPTNADGFVRSTRLGVRLSPNPASGPLAIALTLPEAAAVTVEAFDALGRRVARTEAVLPTGAQRLALDATAWASGLYVVRVTAGDATASGTVVRR